ncbi:MAG: 1-acyl-sn-glycerol-3-phosphate acyltransferase [Bacteroidaceae bacterium]|nr:1-acyl-sn-glycerol-3-phosphate acyltransferase [Bacteroidaceae bacterium]
MKKVFGLLYIVYQFCIALPILIAVTILASVVTIIGTLVGDSEFWGYYPGMIWARLMCIVLLIPVHKYGMENIQKGRTYIIIPNHQSYFDIFMLFGFLGVNFKWIMKKELERIPLVGAACRRCGYIFLDRSSVASSRKSIAKAEETLSKGISIIIFPEGTRTHDGSIGKFRKGAFAMALQTRQPLLPITINGAFNVMSRHAWHVTWHPMSFTVHKPIETGGYNGEMAGTGVDGLLHSLEEKASEVIASDLILPSSGVADR